MMLPFYDKLEELVNDARDTVGIRPFRWPPFILGVILLFTAYIYFPDRVALALQLALFLAPLWLPILLIGGAFELWLVLIRSEFIASKSYVLLEIKLPRNLVKTPLAMETVFANLHYRKGESNWFQIYWQGQVRPYWSLEMTSFGGQIHFFIWTRTDFRKLVENAFYAQYPGVQLVETVDYTRTISAEPGEWDVWGCDFKHTNVIDAYPIKTYVEFGLDKTQKEPEQIDPLAHIIEFLGSVGSNQYFWLQLIFRTHQGEKYEHHHGAGYTWRDQAKEEIAKIRSDIVTVTDTGEQKFPNPTKGQQEKIAAIERNTSKLAFDVGGRAVYIAAPGHFDAAMISGMINLFKPFNAEGWNGIKATHFGIEFSDYPWEIGNEKRKDVFRHHVVEAFRRRQFYHEPFDFKEDSMVMSTEELATIFHIPSSSVQTPGLRRIQSATGEAPGNLPL